MLFKIKKILEIIMNRFPSIFSIILIIFFSYSGVRGIVMMIPPKYYFYLPDFDGVLIFLGCIGTLFFIERVYRRIDTQNNIIYLMEEEFNILKELDNRINSDKEGLREYWSLLSVRSDIEKIVGKERKKRYRDFVMGHPPWE